MYEQTPVTLVAKAKLTAFSFEFSRVVKCETFFIAEFLCDSFRRVSCKDLARSQGNKENRCWEDFHVVGEWFLRYALKLNDFEFMGVLKLSCVT